MYVDDTVLLGTAEQNAETQVWLPTQHSIENEPLLRTLQGRMGDKRGILTLSKTVSGEPENAKPLEDGAFVAAHIARIKQQTLLDDLHLPQTLTKGEAGLQSAWGHERCPAAFCMFEEAMQLKALLNVAMTFKERFIAHWLGGLIRRTYPGTTTYSGAPHRARWFRLQDLAAIARLAALTSRPNNTQTHGFRESTIEKEACYQLDETPRQILPF